MGPDHQTSGEKFALYWDWDGLGGKSVFNGSILVMLSISPLTSPTDNSSVTTVTSSSFLFLSISKELGGNILFSFYNQPESVLLQRD